MKENNPFQNQIKGTGWQFLGELKLPAGSNLVQKIDVWMVETLDQLGLHADFSQRIIGSAQEAVTRALPANAGEHTFDHLHLRLYAPLNAGPNRRAWGFFRIERLDTSRQRHGVSEHSIEYYLYLEGS